MPEAWNAAPVPINWGRYDLRGTELSKIQVFAATGAFSAAALTLSTLNSSPVGATTPSTGNFTSIGAATIGTASFSSLRSTSLQSALVDGSGTPGNVTQNAAHGRAAFAASAISVVVTNSQVAANSSIFISLGGADATLLSVRVTAAAGSFTVTGNAAATGITPFDYLVVQT